MYTSTRAVISCLSLTTSISCGAGLTGKIEMGICFFLLAFGEESVEEEEGDEEGRQEESELVVGGGEGQDRDGELADAGGEEETGSTSSVLLTTSSVSPSLVGEPGTSPSPSKPPPSPPVLTVSL